MKDVLRSGPSVPDPRTRRRIDAGHHLRDLLRSEIVRGELPSGMLPSENELMVAHAASRQVVRDALRLISEEGLVRRVQGTGTFVVVSKVSYGRGVLNEAGHEPEIRHVVLQSRPTRAPAVIARRLRLPEGTDCGVVDYVTYIADEIYSACTAYLPLELLPRIEGNGAGSEWWMRFVRAGLPVGVTSVWSEATIADDVVAELLEVAPGAPIVSIERMLSTTDGDPLEYAFERIRGDRITLRHEIARGSLGPAGPGGHP